jgi:hypothetical protein
MTAPDLIARLSTRLADDALGLTELEDGSGVLLDISGHQVLALNDTAMFVLNRLRSDAPPHDIDTLANAISAEFEITPETARSDAESFLGQLDRLLAQD